MAFSAGSVSKKSGSELMLQNILLSVQLIDCFTFHCLLMCIIKFIDRVSQRKFYYRVCSLHQMVNWKKTVMFFFYTYKPIIYVKQIFCEAKGTVLCISIKSQKRWSTKKMQSTLNHTISLLILNQLTKKGIQWISNINAFLNYNKLNQLW